MILAPLQAPLIWHGYLFAWICGTLAAIWPLPASLAIFFLIFFDKRLWTPLRLLITLSIFISACAYAGWRFADYQKSLQTKPLWLTEWDKAGGNVICGKIVKTQGLPGQRLRILLENVKPPQQAMPLPGLCSMTWQKHPDDQIPLPGQQICLAKAPKPARGFAANDSDDFAGLNTASLFQNTQWRVWTSGDKNETKISGKPDSAALARHRIKQKFMVALLGPDNPNGVPDLSQGILLALLFGDKYYLDHKVVENFSIATLAHSLALSGQHLCVAGFLGIAFVYLAGRVFPSIYLVMPRIILASFASLPLAFAYLWIGGAPGSLMRAVCMLAICTIWLWKGKVFCGVDLLCMALLVILILDPLAIFDIGLQLSALCIAILVICSSAFNLFWLRIAGKIHLKHKKILVNAGKILGISLIIQLAMLPLSLNRFYMAGFWFPLNLIWLPVLATFVLPLAALGLVFSLVPNAVCATVANWLLFLAAKPCGCMISLLIGLKNAGLLYEPAFLLPHWSTILSFGLLLALFGWLFSQKPTARTFPLVKKVCITVLLLLAVGPLLRLPGHFSSKIHVEALDVGQGQAIFLHSGKFRILVDGGGGALGNFDIGRNVVSPLLSHNHSPTLTAVINSHPDIDHLGGLFYVLERYRVKMLFHNGGAAKKAREKKWRSLQKKHKTYVLYMDDIIKLGNKKDKVELQTLYPPPGKTRGEKTNENSIVLRLCKNGNGLAIMPGDVGITGLQRIIHMFDDVTAPILIAPHHGSDKNFLENFYEAVKPQFVVASTGEGNIYKFPGETLVKWLEDNSIPLLNTASLGRIDFSFTRKAEIKWNAARKKDAEDLKKTIMQD